MPEEERESQNRAHVSVIGALRHKVDGLRQNLRPNKPALASDIQLHRARTTIGLPHHQFVRIITSDSVGLKSPRSKSEYTVERCMKNLFDSDFNEACAHALENSVVTPEAHLALKNCLRVLLSKTDIFAKECIEIEKSLEGECEVYRRKEGDLSNRADVAARLNADARLAKVFEAERDLQEAEEKLGEERLRMRLEEEERAIQCYKSQFEQKLSEATAQISKLSQKDRESRDIAILKSQKLAENLHEVERKLFAETEITRGLRHNLHSLKEERNNLSTKVDILVQENTSLETTIRKTLHTVQSLESELQCKNREISVLNDRCQSINDQLLANKCSMSSALSAGIQQALQLAAEDKSRCLQKKESEMIAHHALEMKKKQLSFSLTAHKASSKLLISINRTNYHRFGKMSIEMHASLVKAQHAFMNIRHEKILSQSVSYLESILKLKRYHQNVENMKCIRTNMQNRESNLCFIICAQRKQRDSFSENIAFKENDRCLLKSRISKKLKLEYENRATLIIHYLHARKQLQLEHYSKIFEEDKAEDLLQLQAKFQQDKDVLIRELSVKMKAENLNKCAEFERESDRKMLARDALMRALDAKKNKSLHDEENSVIQSVSYIHYVNVLNRITHCELKNQNKRTIDSLCRYIRRRNIYNNQKIDIMECVSSRISEENKNIIDSSHCKKCIHEFRCKILEVQRENLMQLLIFRLEAQFNVLNHQNLSIAKLLKENEDLKDAHAETLSTLSTTYKKSIATECSKFSILISLQNFRTARRSEENVSCMVESATQILSNIYLTERTNKVLSIREEYVGFKKQVNDNILRYRREKFFLQREGKHAFESCIFVVGRSKIVPPLSSSLDKNILHYSYGKRVEQERVVMTALTSTKNQSIIQNFAEWFVHLAESYFPPHLQDKIEVQVQNLKEYATKSSKSRAEAMSDLRALVEKLVDILRVSDVEECSLKLRLKEVLAQLDSEKKEVEAMRIESMKAAQAEQLRVCSLQKELSDALSQIQDRESQIQCLSMELKAMEDTVGETEEQQLEHFRSAQKDIETMKMVLSEHNRQKERALLRASECNKLEQELMDIEQIRRKLHNQVQELRGNVRVFCRVRPTEESYKSLQIVDSQSMKLVTSKIPDKEQYFNFDRVFDAQSTQLDLFSEVSDLVQSALDGYNVCLFSYGQTGSGKTYTMLGDPSKPEGRGIIPRAVEKIFEASNVLKAKGWTYTLEASYVEIYNESIRDLLCPGSVQGDKFSIVSSSNNGGVPTVSGITKEEILSVAGASDLIRRAAASRVVEATQMNSTSSRSHTLFMLYITGLQESACQRVEGCLILVDLAGSERVEKSGAAGARMKEACAINKSLSCLGDVFTAISNKSKHIPFRNSRLTHLLAPCLSGDGKTLMFVNVAPEHASFDETLCSLRFASHVNSCELGSKSKGIKRRVKQITT